MSNGNMPKKCKKIPYKTKEEAKEALYRCKKLNRDERIYYKCSKCKKYHLAAYSKFNKSKQLKRNTR